MSPSEVPSLEQSSALFEAAKRVIPGGVGSNDRALVRPHPIFISHGSGSHVWDVDGNEYIDYLLAYGPLVLGHADPELVEAVSRQLERGSVYGMAHPLEVEVAELLCEVIPSYEMVRFAQSGTESVLASMRLARAATGRRLIVKFEGQYHGWSDEVALSYSPPSEAVAGPPGAPATVPMSEGQPPGTYEDVVVVQWNDAESISALFDLRGPEIAGVLTEPVMCNYGVIEPEPGYLELLRQLCDAHGALLIFDEVQTGFRLHVGGAQTVYGVTPDLTCLGKALAAGFPVSAIGGRADVMQLIGDRRVFQAGTYNSNPACLAAIPVVIERLSSDGVFEAMASLSQRLREGLAELVRPVGGFVQGTSTVFGIRFGDGPGRNMRELWDNDFEQILRLKHELWLRGVYTKPTPRDIWYVSTAHSDEDVDRTLEVAAEAVGALSRKNARELEQAAT
jgi:glutamate-1-semialdehyde 2,1-aminomutase